LREKMRFSSDNDLSLLLDVSRYLMLASRFRLVTSPGFTSVMSVELQRLYPASQQLRMHNFSLRARYWFATCGKVLNFAGKTTHRLIGSQGKVLQQELDEQKEQLFMKALLDDLRALDYMRLIGIVTSYDFLDASARIFKERLTTKSESLSDNQPVARQTRVAGVGDNH